jgi:hypothetical protein
LDFELSCFSCYSNPFCCISYCRLHCRRRRCRRCCCYSTSSFLLLASSVVLVVAAVAAVVVVSFAVVFMFTQKTSFEP